MQKHNDAIKTSGHRCLEKYTSHFIERVVCERELETEQNCNILTPTLMAITAFLSCSPGLLNRGPGGPASLGHDPHSSIFSPTDLNFLSPGLYNNLMSTYFLRASQFRTQFNSSTVKVAPDLLISSTGCTCYLHWCISSFDSLAGVNMQQEVKVVDFNMVLSSNSSNAIASTFELKPSWKDMNLLILSVLQLIFCMDGFGVK